MKEMIRNFFCFAVASSASGRKKNGREKCLHLRRVNSGGEYVALSMHLSYCGLFTLLTICTNRRVKVSVLNTSMCNMMPDFLLFLILFSFSSASIWFADRSERIGILVRTAWGHTLCVLYMLCGRIFATFAVIILPSFFLFHFFFFSSFPHILLLLKHHLKYRTLAIVA